MSLIFEKHVLDHSAARANRVRHLIGFDFGDTRIVRTLNEKEGSFDLIHMRQRRNLDEETAVGGERAVLGFTQRAPVDAGVLQERDVISDADHTDAGRP